ncbi:MAG: hydroxyisourate hydrolase [Arhodomonas sp.]|nr:hydroxyisourate hydrolase [Arhodomonas sp.]
MGRLTTHILDTAQGHPGAGIRIELRRVDNGTPQPIKEAVTNADGRVDAPLLDGEALTAGNYELVFHVGGLLSTARGWARRARASSTRW